MNLSKLVDSIAQKLKENGPEILTGMGVVGVGTTAYYAAKAGSRSAHLIEAEFQGYKLSGETSFGPVPPDQDEFLTPLQKVKLCWPIYMPVVVSGVGTVACIIFAAKGNTKRTAAAVTAYAATEKAFAEYRDKMVEEIGKRKEQKAIDAIAQEHVRTNPPPAGGIIILGKDESLFCELYTQRYFRSNMEDLKRAINETNRWILENNQATLNDFYNEIGLAATQDSAHLGWNNGEFMDLAFSAVITEDERPCIAFRYNYVRPLR